VKSQAAVRSGDASSTSSSTKKSAEIPSKIREREEICEPREKARQGHAILTAIILV